jgi:DNA-binding MarR family transcriptional regulator
MTNETDLADRDLRVLELVEQYPRPTVTTMREALYWASKNQHVHYRLDKLEERGLIESWKDEDTETRGPLDPRRATTTEAGEALLDDVEHDDGGGSVEERLERIEKRLKRFEDTYGKIKKHIVDAEKRLDEHDEEMYEVREDIERVQRLVDGESMAATVDEFEFGDDD